MFEHVLIHSIFVCSIVPLMGEKMRTIDGQGEHNMGFDMYWKKKPDGEAEVVSAAYAIFMDRVRERDQIPEEERGSLRKNWDEFTNDPFGDEAYEGRSERYTLAQKAVMDASDAHDAARKSYFRLNIWGMGRYRDYMEQYGMGFWPKENVPDLKIDDYGVDWDEVYAFESTPEDQQAYYAEVMPRLTPEKIEKIKEYRAKRDEVLSWHGDTDVPGIPLHKFCDNSGWLVTPPECLSAVKIWERAGEPLPEGESDYWRQWIEFLIGAAKHDGFEVC